jgi:hypothetical protein
VSKEPDRVIELGENSSGHSEWIELYIAVNGGRLRAVEKDSMPVYNESTYVYGFEGEEISFLNGRKSCSGAGKSRSVSPSEEVDELIREGYRELRRGVGAS